MTRDKQHYEMLCIAQEFADKMKSLLTNDYNEMLEKMLPYIPQLVPAIEAGITEEQYEAYGSDFADMIYLSDEYEKNQDIVRCNWEQVKEIVQAFCDSLAIVVQDYGSYQKKCPVCQSKVFYLPLPSMYAEMQAKYGTKMHVPETGSEEEYMCPKCQASDRDRMMIEFLRRIGLEKANSDTKILQIAPAVAIDNWITGECTNVTYHTADLFMKGVDLQLDLMDMQGVQDEAYDLWICSHVLEHVQYDDKALSELKRILKPNGLGVLLVPIALDMDKTDEEWGLSAEENWRRFGQDDHCRQYAKKDFVERVRAAGLEVTELDKEWFGEGFFKQAGLLDTSVLYIVTKATGVLEQHLVTNVEVKEEFEEPLVSVIMSSYNHEKYVARAVESVLSQTYKNIEFLVADDCSTDGTAEVLKKYEECLDYLNCFEENVGCRIPHLLSVASGKYIAHIHSDDYWMPDKLEKQIRYLETHSDTIACATWCKYAGETSEMVSGEELFQVPNRNNERWIRDLVVSYQRNCFCFPSSVWRVEEYTEIVRDAESMAYCQLGDFYVWLKTLCVGEVYVYPEQLTVMNRHATNASAANNPSNMVRHTHQINHICYRLIKDMKPAKFKKIFGAYFMQDAKTDGEIACEKFFLLMRLNYLRQAAIWYYYELYRDLECRECLQKQYHFMPKDFAKLEGENI